LAEKARVRREVNLLRKRMPADEVGWKSRAIADRLMQLEAFTVAECVMLYHSFDNEVLIDEVIDERIKAGKTVLLPRCRPADRSIEPCVVTDTKTDLVLGTYGVMEPHPRIAAFNRLESIDVCIVPGVAFDIRCNRMGRGAGYYDIFLARLSPQTLKIGVAFAFQVQESIPHVEHDIAMDMIVTEQGIVCRPGVNINLKEVT